MHCHTFTLIEGIFKSLIFAQGLIILVTVGSETLKSPEVEIEKALHSPKWCRDCHAVQEIVIGYINNEKYCHNAQNPEELLYFPLCLTNVLMC